MSSPSSHSPTEVSPLARITRCVRRICLLREQGDAEEAARFEKIDFADALRDLRLALGPEILPESELRAMFAAEEKRVADAVVLSELLIPQLVKSFPPFPATVAARAASLPAGERESASVLPRSPAVAAGVSPMIADLLDAMLASERTGRRPLSSAKS